MNQKRLTFMIIVCAVTLLGSNIKKAMADEPAFTMTEAEWIADVCRSCGTVEGLAHGYRILDAHRGDLPVAAHHFIDDGMAKAKAQIAECQSKMEICYKREAREATK